MEFAGLHLLVPFPSLSGLSFPPFPGVPLPLLVCRPIQLQPPADACSNPSQGPQGHSHLLTPSRPGEVRVPPHAASHNSCPPCVCRTTGMATAPWKMPGPRWSSTESRSDSGPEPNKGCPAWGRHTEDHPRPGTRGFHSLRTVLFHR